jgi:hypothetical protein
MRGERSAIVQTMNELAGALQSEVNKHNARPKPPPKPIDLTGFLPLVGGQFERLARMFAESGDEFQTAVGPSGSPQMYVDAYARVLDVLADALDTVIGVEPPAAFARTQQACIGLVQSMYDQVTGWPRKMREATKQVKGDTYDLLLEIDTKATPFQRALQADCKALGL